MQFLIAIVYGILIVTLTIICLLFNHENIYLTAFFVPALMFLAGCMTYSIRNKPGHIAGFRTEASKRNADTWQFANTHYGITMMKWSIPLLFISEFAMYVMKPEAFIAQLMCFLQVIPYLAAWVSTEHALSNAFDYQGNRRDMMT